MQSESELIRNIHQSQYGCWRELREKGKSLVLICSRWLSGPTEASAPHLTARGEPPLRNPPPCSPSSSHFCGGIVLGLHWDICRKQVTHSGMCVAWHRPLQLRDWSHSSGSLVKADRLQACDSSRRILCSDTQNEAITAETLNQSLFLLWQDSTCASASTQPLSTSGASTVTLKSSKDGS